MFPGVSALFWADVDPVGNLPQPRQPRGEKEEERKHCLLRARTRATAPLTLAAGIRERLSRESLRLKNDSEGLLFIFPRCRDLSSCLHVATPRTSMDDERNSNVYGIRYHGYLKSLDVLTVKLRNLSVMFTKIYYYLKYES